jgi:anthranilate synthase component I
VPEPLHPSPTEFAELASAYTVVPVWREVLADLETPVSVFLKLVGGGEGFLLESVEHGERWGRYSFVGRDPALTLVARGGAVRWLEGPDATLAVGLPDDRGALGALEALLARYRAPRLPELPPFHGGIVGWLGYDVVREIERLENVPAGDPGLPDAVMSLTGHVAAFDHFRQRIYLIENVLIPPGAGEAEIGAAYAAAAGRLDALVDDLARPLPYQPVAPPTASCPRSGPRWPVGPTAGRWRWPASTSWPATSSRWSWPSGSTSSSAAIPSTSTGSCAR